MEKRINVAELLKDCPKGMELDCVICNGVKFIELDRNPNFPIVVRANNGYEFTLTRYGQVHNIDDAKCVIFPKGKTTWEGFVPHCKFKDGDIVATNDGHWIGITTGGKNGVFIPTYCIINANGIFEVYLNQKETWQFHRLATEEEKQKLFDAIKDNGYKWNADTKTLEKLITPKFKVGDRIRYAGEEVVIKIIDIKNNQYHIECFCDKYNEYKNGIIPVSEQEHYILIPNFSISTLKPFESRVLVRDYDNQIWIPTFWGKYIKDGSDCYLTTNGCYRYCIPYNEETKHLIGTTNNCENFYKTWTEP